MGALRRDNRRDRCHAVLVGQPPSRLVRGGQFQREPRALARTVGWVAQWNEMISDPGQKIGRPRQLYTGPTQRDYVPLENR
jgi:hypothetical protein